MAEEQSINPPGGMLPPVDFQQDKIIDDPGFGGYDKFDFESIKDRVLESDPQPSMGTTLDPEYKAMLDSISPIAAKFPIGPTVNANSPTPGDSGVTYNPYSQNNAPDLSTSEGRARYMHTAGAQTNKLFPDMAPGKVDTYEIGLRQSNFMRYYKHASFNELGWNPHADNESHYNRNSTAIDDLGRMAKEWPSLFGTGFMSVYRSWGDLFGDGSYTAPDIVSALEFEEAMAIGNSSRGGLTGFANNLALNSAYTFGIIGSIALEELALAGLSFASGGILAPAATARTAANIGKLGRAFSHMPTARFVGATMDMVKTLNSVDKARDFWSLSNGGRALGKLFIPETQYAWKTLKTTQQAGTNLMNIAKMSPKMFGGFYRDLRAVNLAVAESKLESGMVYNKTMNDEYVKVKKGLSGKTQEEISQTSTKAATAAFWWNAPLIYTTNKLVLDGALRGFKPMGRVLDETISGVGARVLRNKKLVANPFYDAGTGFKRVWNLGFKGSGKALGVGSLRYLSANFAEGFQEIGQEAIAVGAQDYYTTLLHDSAVGANYAFNASVSKALGSQMSHQGFEVFMSGFLMGGLVQPVQNFGFKTLPQLGTRIFNNKEWQSQKEAKENYVSDVVKNLNTAWTSFTEDPSQYFDESRLNAVSQKRLATELMSASYHSDVLGFMDVKDQSVFGHLYTIASAGKMGHFVDQLKSFQNLDKKELLEAFPEFAAEVENGKINERIGKMITRADDMVKSVKQLDDKFVNPYDRRKFTEGSREYNNEALKQAGYNQAKFMAMFTRNTFVRATERMNQIYTEFSADPVIANLAANDLAAFTSTKKLKTELEVLRKELEGSDTQPLTKEQSEEKKVEIDKLNLELQKEIQAIVLSAQTKAKEERQEEIQQKIEKVQIKYNRKKNNLFLKYDKLVQPSSSLNKEQIGIYEQKKKKLHLLENYADILFGEENLMKNDKGESIRDSRRPGGYFDKKNISKLRTAFVDILNHLAKEGDTIVLKEKLDETLDKMLDYEFLSGRQEMYAQALDVLIEPERMNVLADRLSIVMKKIWEGRKKAVKEVVAKYVDDKDKNAVLNALAAPGLEVYPTPEGALSFLMNGTKPKEFMDQGGIIDEQSDVNKWEQINNIFSEYYASKAPVKEATENEFEEEFDAEEVFDATISNETQEVLSATYNRYRSNGGQLSKSQWGQTEVAKNIIKARSLMENLWRDHLIDTGVIDAHLSNEETEEILLTGEYNGHKFNTWYKTNQKDMHHHTYNAYNLSYNDLTVEGINNPQAPEDTKTTSAVKGTGEQDHWVIKHKVVEGSKTLEYFTIVNSDGPVDIKLWGPQIKDVESTYLSEAEAVRVYKAIVKILDSRSETFKWGSSAETITREFKQFDIVTVEVDGEVTEWKVISTASTIKGKKNRGKLAVVPIDQMSGDVKFLTVAEWKKQGWKQEEYSFKNINETVKDGKQKLRKTEPVQFYPYQIRGQQQWESSADAHSRFNTFLSNLTPEELNGLTITVTKQTSKKSLAVKDQQPGDRNTLDIQKNAKAEDKKYAINEQIKQGYEDLVVELSIQDPKVQKKYNEIFGKLVEGDPGDPTKGMSPIFAPSIKIGFLQGPTAATLLDTSGKEVNPLTITEENVHQWYAVWGDTGNFVRALKQNYAQSIVFYDKLYEKLGDKNTTELKVKDLSDAKLFITPGKFEYNPKNPIPIADLSHNTIGTVDGKPIYWIIDQRKREIRKGEKQKGRSIITNLDEDHEMYDHFAKVVSDSQKDSASFNYSSKLGRYVLAVTMPDNTLAFVELKANMLDNDQALDLFMELKQEQDRVSRPVSEGGNLDVVKGEIRPQPVDVDFTVAFNEKFNNKFYITGKPGEYIEIQVMPSSDIQVRYRSELITNSLGKAETVTFTLQKKIIDAHTLETLDQWLELLNVNIKGKDKLRIGEGKKPSNIKFTPANFRINIPLKTSLEELETNTTTSLQPQMKTGRILKVMVTNSTLIDEVLNTNFEPVVNTEDVFTGAETVDPVDQFSNINLGEDPNAPVVDPFAGVNTEDDPNAPKPIEPTQAEKQNQLAKDIQDEIDTLNNQADEIREKIKIEAQNEAREAGEKANLTKEEIDYAVKKATMMAVTTISGTLQAINAKIAEAQKRMPWKILRNFDGKDVEDIDVFIKWVETNLPSFITIGDISDIGERLKNSGVTVGAFLMTLDSIKNNVKDLGGTILTSAKNPYKYHEAFHGVFRLLLTDEEQESLLRAAGIEVKAKLAKEFKDKDSEWYGKSFKDVLSQFRDMSPMYTHLSQKELIDLYYEEYIADEFEAFKMDPKSAKVNADTKSWFTRIIEWIKTAFSRFTKNELNTLFENIDAGKYSNAKIQTNKFTQEQANDNGVVNVALAPIPYDTVPITRMDHNGQARTVYTNVYLPEEQSKTIVNQIASNYLMAERDWGTKPGQTGLFDMKEHMDLAIAQYINMYNPERNFYINGKSLEWIEENGQKLGKLYKSLLKYAPELRVAVIHQLNNFDIQYNTSYYTVESFEETLNMGNNVRSTEDYNKDSSMIGGFSAVATALKKFIATTFIDSTLAGEALEDEFGNIYLDDEAADEDKIRYRQPVDFNVAYTGMLKAVKNLKDPMLIMQRMLWFSQGNPETAAVVDRIFTEIGITHEDVENSVMPAQLQNPLFFQTVIKGFTQFRMDYLFVERDSKGAVHLYYADQRDAAHSQFDIWQQAYYRRLAKMKTDYSYNEEVYRWVDKKKKLFVSIKELEEGSARDELVDKLMKEGKSKEESEEIAGARAVKTGAVSRPNTGVNSLENVAQTFSNELYEKLGIKLSKTYLMYSLARGLIRPTKKQQGLINSNSDVLPLSYEDLEALADIQLGDTENRQAGNIFMDAQGLGASSRLKKIAIGNSKFDETIGATVILNAEGNWVYSHQQSNFVFEKIAEMSGESADYFKDMKANSSFLNGNYLANDLKFQKLVKDGGVKLISVAGSKKADREFDPETGDVTGSSGTGVTFGSSTPKEYLLDLINTYTLSYNRENETVSLTEYEDKYGNTKYFTTAPTMIRVLEQSNQGYMATMPIIKTVGSSESGGVELTEEAKDIAYNEILNEYNRILREVDPLTSTQDSVEGYNIGASRGFKLWYTGNLLTPRKELTQNRIEINAPRFSKKGFNKVRERIISGNQTLMIRDANEKSYIGLHLGNSSIIELDDTEDTQKPVKITNRGFMGINELNINKVIEQLGDTIQTTKSKTHTYYVNLGKGENKIKVWVDTIEVMKFLTGASKMYLYDMKIDPATEEVVEEINEIEAVESIPKEIRDTIAYETQDQGAHNAHWRLMVGDQTVYFKLIRDTKKKKVTNEDVKVYLEDEGNPLTQEELDAIAPREVTDLMKMGARNKVHAYGPIEEKLKALIAGEEIVKESTTEETTTEELETETVVNEYILDESLKEHLEAQASEGVELEDALKSFGTGLTIEDLKNIVATRMMDEFNEFIVVMKEIKAYNEVSNDIKKGIVNKSGIATESSIKANAALNLTDEMDYNLAQIFFNDWFNTKSVTQILLGDQAMTLKDAVDQIKRAKALIAAGSSAESNIIAPEFGITETFNQEGDLRMLTIEDETSDTKYSGTGTEVDGVEDTDGQTYMTEKGARYTSFGLGNMSVQIAKLLDQVKEGEYIDGTMFFGSKDRKGYKDYGAVLNSEKFVYFDGTTFLKMSTTYLTKQFTSWIDPQDPVWTQDNSATERAGMPKWIALPGQVKLHNMRVKMENEETRGGVVITAPKSAVKMLKKNVLNREDAWNDSRIESLNLTPLSPGGLRLQQVNPSNKITVTSPNQMKHLISYEQDDSQEVIIGDKVMTIKEVKELYNHSIKDRVTVNYIQRRNLLFKFDEVQDSLQESIDKGLVSLDLRAFMKYAVDNLLVSGARSSTLEYFSKDINGDPKYNLNNPLTAGKFQELIMTFFNKGVLKENIPGHVVALVSGAGYLKLKKVKTLDEFGQPESWDIIRDDEYKTMSNRPSDKDIKKGAPVKVVDEETGDERTEKHHFLGLEVGDYYLDVLRHNVKTFKNGEYQGERHSEFVMPAHFKEIMEKIMYHSKGEFKSSEDIMSEWYNWTTTMQPSYHTKEDIIRADIEDFDPNRSRIEFAAAFNYEYDDIEERFEDKNPIQGQDIPEVLWKMFGVRIPSQDKHSTISLKLVDFMPVYYGSSAIFSNDIVEISGADFDIDKLYMHIKEFYNLGKDFYEYGKAHKLYDVIVEMYEHKTVKDKTGDFADIWVADSIEQAKEQLALIRKGKGGGTNFTGFVERNAYSYTLKHKKGDNKIVYIKNLMKKEKVKLGDVKRKLRLDPKGRRKGKTYFQGGVDVETSKYADYIRWVTKQSFKRGTSLNDALNVWEEEKKIHENKQEEIEREYDDEITLYFTPEKIEDKLGPQPGKGTYERMQWDAKFGRLVLAAQIKFLEESDKNLIRHWNQGKLSAIRGVLTKLGMPISKDEYNTYKKKYKHEPYTAPINNNILDYKVALLGNEGMTVAQEGRDTPIAYEPANLTPLYDKSTENIEDGIGVWNYMHKNLKELVELVEGTGIDADNLNGKLRAWIDNKDVSIGAVVLPNVVLNFLGENNIEWRSRTITVDGQENETIPQLHLNKWTYSKFNSRHAVDTEASIAASKKAGKIVQVEDTKAFRTQYVISSLITAMTDNAKEVLAVKLGLNRDAVAVAANMIKLGVSVKTALLLVNNPVIKDLYWKHFNPTTGSSDKIYTLLNTRIDALEGSVGSEKMNVTDELLEEAIKKQKTLKMFESGDVNEGDQKISLSILNQFKSALAIKNWTAKLNPILDLTSGIGSKTADIEKRNDAYYDLGMFIESDNVWDNFTISVGKHVDYPGIDVRRALNEKLGATSWEARYVTIERELVNGLLPVALFTRTDDFVRMKNIVVKNLIQKKWIITPERRQQIESDILSYLTIKAYIQGLRNQQNSLLASSLQNEFIYGGFLKDESGRPNLTIASVVEDTVKYLKTANNGQQRSNFFIQHFATLNKQTSLGNMVGLDLYESNTFTKMGNDLAVQIQNSFLELYAYVNADGTIDTKMRANAIHIAHYLMVKDGLQFKRNTIASAIPPVIYDNYLSQIHNAHHIFNLKTRTPEAFNAVFGSSLEGLYDEFLENYMTYVTNASLLPEVRVGSHETYDPKKNMDATVWKYNSATPNAVDKLKNTLFIFPENLQEEGQFLHQKLRGKKNAFGITIKLKPGSQSTDLFSDISESENIMEIDRVFDEYNKIRNEYDDVVFFSDMFGTDKERKVYINDMKRRAPNTFKHLKQNLIDHFGYNIEVGLTKQLAVAAKAKSTPSPVRVDEIEGTLTVDKFKGLITYSNNDKEGRVLTKGKKKFYSISNVKDPKTGKFLPTYRIASKIRDKVKKQESILWAKGFKDKKKVYIDNTYVYEIGFPMAIKVKKGGGYTSEGETEYYLLESVWSSSEAAKKDINTSNLLSEGELMAYGNKAVYKKVTLKGSFAAWAGAGMLSPLPAWKEISAWVKEKEADLELGISSDQEFNVYIPDEADFSKIDSNEDPSKKNTLIEAKDVTYKKGEPVIESTPADKEPKDQDFGESIVNTNEAPIIYLDDIKPGGTVSDQFNYRHLKKYYSDLTEDEQAKLKSGKLAIQNIEDFIKMYEETRDVNGVFSEEEYIEQIKTCY